MHSLKQFELTHINLSHLLIYCVTPRDLQNDTDDEKIRLKINEIQAI